MADYSEIIEEIRRNNERLEEKARKAFQKRQEEEEQQRKLEEKKRKEKEIQRQKAEEKKEQENALIRDAVISCLLEIIKDVQQLGKRVRKIALIEKKQEQEQGIEIRCMELVDEKVYNSVKNLISAKSFYEHFGVQGIDRIYEAFGLKAYKRESEALDGFFSILLETEDFREDLAEDMEEYDFYFLFNKFSLNFFVNY